VLNARQIVDLSGIFDQSDGTPRVALDPVTLEDRGPGDTAIEGVELPFAKTLDVIGPGEIADVKTITLPRWAVLSGPFSDRGR
jgi:hypothetical protein